ncbi:binding protein [[Candida] boidinii]|nr:binding protein [[Candida] boidinii]
MVDQHLMAQSLKIGSTLHNTSQNPSTSKTAAKSLISPLRSASTPLLSPPKMQRDDAPKTSAKSRSSSSLPSPSSTNSNGKISPSRQPSILDSFNSFKNSRRQASPSSDSSAKQNGENDSDYSYTKKGIRKDIFPVKSSPRLRLKLNNTLKHQNGKKSLKLEMEDQEYSNSYQSMSSSSSSSSSLSSSSYSDPVNSKSNSKSNSLSPLDIKQSDISDSSLPVSSPNRDLRSRSLSPDINNNNNNKNNNNDIKKKAQTWEEPPLAGITTGITGQALEMPPTNKIKKEGLWPKQLTIRRSSKRLSQQANQKEEVSQEELIKIEDNYISNLNTKDSEPITELSTLREETHRDIHPVPKKGSKLIVRLPLTPKKRSKDQSESGDDNFSEDNIFKTPKKKSALNSKRIKQSPKSHTNPFFGYSTKHEIVDTSIPRLAVQQNNDPTLENDDFCSACGYPGKFLCCEGCPKSFHFLCCDPPMEEDNLPEGSWFCRECLAERNKTIKYDIGIFSKLLNQAEKRNPTSYALPKKIRDFFQDVSTGSNGEYVDNNSKPPNKVVRNGYVKEIEQDQIYDKDGNALFCYKCGLSGLNERQITTCDYCDLAWHLDCVDPPLTAPKRLGSKWKCPNHSDYFFSKRRRLKKEPVVEVSMTRGFIADPCDIEVLNTEDEFEKDSVVYDNISKPILTQTNSTEAIDPSEDVESSFVDPNQIVGLETPQFFEWNNTKTGISVPMPESLSNTFNNKNVTYKLKEKSIVLDFIRGAKIKRMNEINKIEENNIQILNQSDAESKNYIYALSNLSNKQIINNERKKLNLNQLLEVTDKNYKELNLNIKDSLKDSEIESLMKIKKLMELKGQDELLKFLSSE